MKKIALLFGGPSLEHDGSLASAANVAKAIESQYKFDLVKIHRNGQWQFLHSSNKLDLPLALTELKKRRYSLALIVMHGAFGEDGHVQALLESIGLPYAGSNSAASAVAMDKQLSNDIYSVNGLKVAPYIVVRRFDRLPRIKLPAVVKPAAGGSSVGIYVVKNKKTLEQSIKKCFKIADRVMIQKFIPGREFTCGIIEQNGQPRAVTPTEIIPKSEFFDYSAKYKVGGSIEITPPNLSKNKIKELQILALKAHRLLNCAGMSRSDFILSGSKFYILETNTIPGLTETSLLPQGAKASGVDFKELMNLIIQSAHV